MAISFKGGVHPNSMKLTANSSILSMPPPKVAYVPVLQHIGKPAHIMVEVGDKVAIGQRLAGAEGFVSSNIFSPVSGTVKEISDRPTVSGKTKHIVIENDFGIEKVELPPVDISDRKEILQRIAECGIVGMGGAGFPTSVKLSPKTKVDTLIVNAAECEPYITCDYRIMTEYSREFAEGVRLAAKALGAENIIVGIEDNKRDAAEKISALGLNTVVLKTKYPQGAEKQLIYALTKRKVPVGGLPSDIGAVVINVHTALSAYFAVVQGQPLYRRVMTVTGYGIAKPCNVMVSVGTLIKDIIEFCGGYSEKETVKMVSGGPMMGITVYDTECAVTKTTSCLLLMTADEAFCGNPEPCINCGKCARSCPMDLMPMYIDAYALVNDFDNASKYGANNCIECGCCAYTCPAKRPLVQSIRLAKKKLKERGTK